MKNTDANDPKLIARYEASLQQTEEKRRRRELSENLGRAIMAHGYEYAMTEWYDECAEGPLQQYLIPESVVRGVDGGPVDDGAPPSPVGGITTPWELEALQALVGGLIQVVPVMAPLNHAGDWLLVVNEEGAIYDLSFNPRASWLARQVLVGPAVLIRRSTLE